MCRGGRPCPSLQQLSAAHQEGLDSGVAHGLRLSTTVQGLCRGDEGWVRWAAPGDACTGTTRTLSAMKVNRASSLRSCCTSMERFKGAPVFFTPRKNPHSPVSLRRGVVSR